MKENKEHKHQRRRSGIADDVFLNFISDKAKARAMKQALSQKQPRRGRPRQPNKSRKLTTSDLRDNAKVLEWYAATKVTPVSLYDAELFNVFAAAECALDHGDNPPALFAWLVHGRRWGMLTNEQDDAARQRVLTLRDPERAAELRRRHDDDDSAEVSEPLFQG